MPWSEPARRRAATEGAPPAAANRGGGTIVFDCGPDPCDDCRLRRPNRTADTIVDGGGLVTLDGGNGNRILSVPSSFELGTPT